MIRSLYVKSPSIASTSSTIFWWALQTQTESQPKHTIWFSRHRTLRTQYLHFGIILWKQHKILASYKHFWKLQSVCLCTPLLTLTWSFFSSTYLLKLSSSKTFVTRLNVSVVIAFPFLGAGFVNISPTFLISYEGIQRH